MASTVLAKMAVQISANTADLVRATQQGSRSITALSKTVESAGKLMATYFGTQAIFSGISYGIGVLAGFEQKMQEVRAVTGATEIQFKALQKNATDLGAATEYTATQIAGLQAEFGRLGFSTKEILDSTKATVNLATATGSDLARSAEIAGSTLRAYGLDAKEMGRVTDVMASSFNKSALQLDNFAESIKYVAPIAKAAGVSLEETTAYLSALADSGIKGSQAGTAMRRIFAELSKDGRPVAERMQELASKGLTLSDAFDEVGRYAQTALLVLGENNEKTKELTKTYQEASGEAKRTADIMRDTLAGDFKLLTSAIDGAIQKGTIFSMLLRTLTQGATDFINNISGANSFTNALEALASDLNSGGNSLDFYVQNLKRVKEETGATSISFTELIKVVEGMGNRATVLERLKEQLAAIGIEITDISKVTLGPNAPNLFGPPPGYTAAQTAAMLRYNETLKTYSLLLRGIATGKGTQTFSDTPISAVSLVDVKPFKEEKPYEMQFDMADATKGIQTYVDKLREAEAETQKLNKSTQDFSINLSGLAAGALSDISYAFGQAAASGMDFGKTILKAVSGFMKSFGEQLIAIGVAKLGLDKLFVTGYGAAFAIAAGAALVAAAGALNASGASAVSSLNSGGGGRSGSFYGSSISGTQNTLQIQVNGTLKAEGQQLVAVINSATQSNSFRKG